MRDQILQRKGVTEYKAGRFFLQIYGSAVRTENHALTDAYVGAGNFHSFFVRGLREQEDLRSGPRAANCLLNQSGSGYGNDDQVCATATGNFFNRANNIVRSRIQGQLGSELSC